MYNKKVIIDAIKNLNKAKTFPKYNNAYTNNKPNKKNSNNITSEQGVNTPVFKSVHAAPSKIHGKGLFTQEPISKGDTIGVSHIRKKFMKNNEEYQAPFPSKQLGYYNHSESPNVYEVDNGDHIIMKAKRNINPGEELTANYYNANIKDLENPDNFKKGGATNRPKLPNKKNSKAYSRSFEATNRLFAQNPLFSKPKSRKNKIFDPNSPYFQPGGETDLPQNVGITYLSGDDRSYYSPLDDTIYLNPNASDSELNHELVHAWQNRTGRLRSNPNLPQQRPPIVASDEQAASYYTRKGDDVDYYLNNLSTLYPNLTDGNIWTEDLNRFMPEQIKYDKVIEPLMYLDPNTMEGEAEMFSQVYGPPPGISFRKKGGALPKAQDGPPEEFYKNWYKNRVMPTPEGQKLLEKIRPEALERASQNVPYIYSEELNPDEAGYYDTETQQILLNKFLPEAQIEATKQHEFGHHIQAGDKFYDVLGKPHQYLVEQNIIGPKEINTGNPEWDKNLKKNYDDITNPDEIHARIMTLRNECGFKPDQVITEKDIEDCFKRKKEAGEALDPDIEDLRGVTKGNQSIVNLLNDMVSVPSNREDLNVAQNGGSPYRTNLSPEDEKRFQKFYATLPENLQTDDATYDIRGYWDSEGRPEKFNYDQPKQDDGYYHAYSINSNTNKYLKSPWHPTFQHAVDEDRKIGYRPIVNVRGEVIATENPALQDEYIETELTPEEIEQYAKGGYIVEDISVPTLTRMQDGGLPKAFEGRPVKIKEKEKEKEKESEKINAVNTNIQNLGTDYRPDVIAEKTSFNLGNFIKPLYDISKIKTDISKALAKSSTTQFLNSTAPETMALIAELKNKNIISPTLSEGQLVTYPNLLNLATKKGIQDKLTLVRSAAGTDYGISSSGTKTELAPGDLEAYRKFGITTDPVGKGLYGMTHVPWMRYGQRTGLYNLPYQTQYVKVYKFGEGEADYVVADNLNQAREVYKTQIGGDPETVAFTPDTIKQATPDSYDALYTYGDNTGIPRSVRRGVFDDQYGTYTGILRYPFDYSGSAFDMFGRFNALENETFPRARLLRSTAGREGATSGALGAFTLTDKATLENSFISPLFASNETPVIGKPGEKLLEPVAVYHKPELAELDKERDYAHDLYTSGKYNELIEHLNNRIKQGQFGNIESNIQRIKEKPEFTTFEFDAGERNRMADNLYMNGIINPETGLIDTNLTGAELEKLANLAYQSYNNYLYFGPRENAYYNKANVEKIPYSPFRFKFKEGGQFELGDEVELTKEQLKKLQEEGYTFEIVK